MKVQITLKRTLLTLLGLGLAGFLFAWSGVFQISASSGHWRVTDWFLHFAMRSSVRTYAAFDAPEEAADDRGLVSAAGHYAQACMDCHGAPGVRPSPAMQGATPPAPDLAVNARQWSDRQLFWIIRHGVKYTGMPAWPAERADEVRRMVAFVRRLPGMTPAQYRALTQEAGGQPIAGPRPELLATCTGCHGADGRGRGQGDIPILGGQRLGYLREALQRYASGARKSGVMQVAAASLSSTEMEALASHFAAMPGLADVPPAGHPLVLRGDPARQLPACASCHAPGKSHPVLAGQKRSYLAARLRAWRGDPATVDAHKSPETMAVIARRIPGGEIDEIAAGLAGSRLQPPG
jgi:cytochrome c553